MPRLSLSKIIQQNNIHDLHHYIKHNVSNDPKNLQRIYQQLKLYQADFRQLVEKNKINMNKNVKIEQNDDNIVNRVQKQEDQQLRVKRHKSLNNILSVQNQPMNKKFPSTYINYFKKSSQQELTQRHNKLIRSLREKGFRPSTQSLPLGLELLQKQQQRRVKPLKSNPTIIVPIDKQIDYFSDCLKRFNLNKKFYKNQIQNAEIEEDKCYDREMKGFLEKRQESLMTIVKKKQFQVKININKGSNINNINNLNKINIINSSMKKINKNVCSTGNLKIQSMINEEKQSRMTLRQKQKQMYTHRINTTATQLKKQQLASSTYRQQKDNFTKNLIFTCDSILKQFHDPSSKSLFEQKRKISSLKQQTNQISSQMNHLCNRLQYGDISFNNTLKDMKQFGYDKGKNNLIDKYNVNYIKYMRRKKEQHEQVLMNRNDLIKNQAKFRELVADRRG